MKLAAKLQALSNAVMQSESGDVSAALDGSRGQPAGAKHDHRRSRAPKGSQFRPQVQEKVAIIGPKVKREMMTVQRTLPRVMHDLNDAQKSIERAVSNLPDPTYPQR